MCDSSLISASANIPRTFGSATDSIAQLQTITALEAEDSDWLARDKSSASKVQFIKTKQQQQQNEPRQSFQWKHLKYFERDSSDGLR